MTNSTYVTFKDRLNRYFNSTNDNDIMILTEITDGVVYPTMSEEEIMRVKVYVNKDGVVYSEKEIKEALPDIIANYEYFGYMII